tara:strand:- start:1145 stop:1591 length:447 start_codon:yes stop_codon:yes gene_type:complete
MAKIIEGLKFYKPKVIKDKRGSVLHMIKRNSEIFKKFGEIYFTTLNPKMKKGWNLHKKMTLNLVCIKGKIKVVLYDDRNRSKTYKKINVFYLSRNKYSLLTIPPNIWCGYKNLSKNESILANCSTLPHDPNEVIRKSLNDKVNKFYDL